MPTPDVDAERIVATLNDHGVRYVVVGGFAVELWDVAVQPTVDVDITPERSRENLARLAMALDRLGARIRSGSETIMMPGGWNAQLLEQMTFLNLATEAGPLDITMVPAGTDGFADLARNARDLVYGNVVVPTADLSDVARSKEAAGRPKDLRALPAIIAHLRRLGRT